MPITSSASVSYKIDEKNIAMWKAKVAEEKWSESDLFTEIRTHREKTLKFFILNLFFKHY